jgi:hypothetical protein
MRYLEKDTCTAYAGSRKGIYMSTALKNEMKKPAIPMSIICNKSKIAGGKACRGAFGLMIYFNSLWSVL